MISGSEPKIGASAALQDALERAAATREILEAISRSRDDVQPVLDTIVQSAARLCKARDVGLHLVNEAGTHSRLAAALSRNPETFRIGDEFDLSSPLQTAMAIREARIIHMPDIADDPLYHARDPIRVKLVEEDGIRSRLCVPLRKDGGAFGCINLNRAELRPFTDVEIALIETFAAQAVIAIENVRQFRKLQTRLRREAATREILQVISRSRDDEGPVFDAILDNAQRLCNAPFGNLSIAVNEGTNLEIVTGGTTPLGPFRPGWRWPVDSEILVSRAFRERRTLHVENIAADPLYLARDPNRVITVDAGIRTHLAVPLISGNRAIGTIALYRREISAFTQDEIELVQTFAAQAVIAIENVRQFRELQTRLEREAATREILQVISQSRADTGPVFQAILENARRLCNAPMAMLSIANEERTRVTVPASLGAREAFAEALEGFDHPIDAPLIAVRPIADGQIIHMADCTDDELYRSGHPTRILLADVEGVRTILAVPMISNGISIGAIILYRREVQPFDDGQIELVKTFADQAAIAIENVRQFRELQTRLEREAASREILGVISRSRDDEGPVFDAILENAARLCRSPMARLHLLEEDGQRRRLAAHWGESMRSLEIGETMAMDEGHPISLSILEARLIHIEDISETNFYKSGDPLFLRLVEEEGLRTLLTVPLLRDSEAFGCIALSRREVRPFAEDEIALVETFAAQAVIAIENVRQFKALEARTEELHELNASLEGRVATQVGEIERMGRLKRFLSPAVADAVVTSGDEKLLGSHRALIAVLFCDIRGFTAFCETAEPEETIEVLQTYHEEMGKLINAHGAGVDHRSGDGIMVIFNDPLPCDDPAGDALRMAMAMRDRMAELCKGWRRLGHRLGFGVGISLGYATVGMVGSEGRYDYTASGTAVNLAARLCDEAADGEILLSPRAYAAVEDEFPAESKGEISLKGISAPVEIFRVTSAAATS